MKYAAAPRGLWLNRFINTTSAEYPIWIALWDDGTYTQLHDTFADAFKEAIGVSDRRGETWEVVMVAEDGRGTPSIIGRSWLIASCGVVFSMVRDLDLEKAIAAQEGKTTEDM